MRRLPPEFEKKYADRDDEVAVKQVARFLYHNHGQQYTLDEIADEVGVAKSRVSQVTQDLRDDDWVNSHEGSMTLVWNTEAHNPATTEPIKAVSGLYSDLYRVFQKHRKTTAGMIAITGVAFLITGLMMLSVYLGAKTGVIVDSNAPVGLYLGAGLGGIASWAVLTMLSPIQAAGNNLRHRLQSAVITRLGTIRGESN
ncbi:hypothetical protein [Halosimplex marinum]|uniref:hypothetical protein n=1 Tax=Halosimplex marinum TaxID=3396620 RepID=UPI003F56A1F3